METLWTVKNVKFVFEDFIKDEIGLVIDFDPSSRPEICKAFERGYCYNGNNCPLRHIKPEKTVVCKHWLRGLCKKGDNCEFLHEYNLKRMPECWFYSKYGECSNPECVYLHIDPESKIKECVWYTRGFCKHGPKCRNKHVRQVVCQNYLFGFCPKGLDCSHSHPKWIINATFEGNGEQ